MVFQFQDLLRNGLLCWPVAEMGVGGAMVVSLFNERFTYRRIRSKGSPNMF